MKRLWLLAVVLLFCMSQAALGIRPAVVGDVVHKGGGVYDVRAYGATGDGVTDDYTAINNAATAAAGETLEFKAGTYKIGTNISLDEDVLFYDGAMLSIDSGVTVTFSGTLKTPIRNQIISGAGLARLSPGVCDAVYPQWWGALGDGSNDDTSAFDAAMSASWTIGKMKIPSGTYKITSPLQTFPTGSFASAKDGYIIEGCGTETVINYTGTTGYTFEIDSSSPTDANVPIGVTIRDLHIELGSITSADVGGGILSVGSFTNIERITTTNADNATGIHARARNTTETESGMANDTNRDFTTTGAGATEKYAIKFTSPTRAATFKSAVVRLGITGAPAGTVHAELWTDSTGTPGAQIAGGDSDTVTINTISSAADGEDVTLDFGDSGGRPAISGATVYWLVISTTGYTYTDGVTELRLRVDAGDGAASGFSTYDAGGVSWSETNDGANHTFNCRYGQPLQVNVNGCGIQSTTAIGRAFWLEDNSFMNITNTYADSVEGIRSEYSFIEWHNLYLVASGVPVYSTGWSRLFGGVIEGSAAYPLYFGGIGHTHRLVGVGNAAAPVTWESGTWLSQEQCNKDFWWSDYADVVPDGWRYRIIPAMADNKIWDTYDATLATDADALNGNATQLNAANEYIQVIWGTTKIYSFLPRGTYKVTMWMKDTNQVANDMIVRSDFYDGSWNTDFENTFTLSSDYKPYTLLMRLDATQNADISYQKRIWLRKATAGANTISVSHVTIEYIGPDIVGDQNVIAVSTDRSNADQARESQIEFWGSKADGYQSALGQIQGQHDGTSDDYKGEIDIKLNTSGETYDTLTSIMKISTTVDSLVDGDTTPPVSGGNLFKTANTGGTTITMFDSGVSGKSIVVMIDDANTTLDFSGTNLKGNGGSDWTAAAGDVLYATFDGTDWYCTISNPDGAGGLWREEATDNFFGPATAGAALTTGDYNTAGGDNALADITQGSGNTTFGFDAGNEITWGTYNSAFGYQAMNGNADSGGIGGISNVALGHKAGYGIYGGDYNVAIGFEAGYDLSSSNNNVAIGLQALYTASGTTAQNMVAIGNQAFYLCNDGTHGIAIGNQALKDFVGGSTGGYSDYGNIGIGWLAAENFVSGEYNTFIGYKSGYDAVKGSKNIAIGELALDSLGATTNLDVNNNIENIGIGANAGEDIDGGRFNVCIGTDSGRSITDSDSNIAVGGNSLEFVTTGEFNTGVGNTAGNNLSVGDFNSAFGDSALGGSLNLTNVSGDYNTAIGYLTGGYVGGDSNRNVYLGAYAGPAVQTTEDDQLYIGNSVDPDLIRGDFSTSTVTINGTLNATGATGSGNFSSSADGGTVLSSANTHADLTVATYLLDLDFTDDGDAEGNFLRCRDNSAGDVKFLLGANGFVDITPNGITGAGNRVFEITPVDVLPASAHISMLRLVGDNLDPSGASTRIRGFVGKFDDVDLTNDPEINAIRIVMPVTYTGEQDMAAFYASGNGHIIEFMDNDKGRNSIWTDGEIEQDYTVANTANTVFSPIQVNLDVDDLAATSEVHALGVSATGTTTGDYCAVSTNGSVCVIHQHIGAFATPDQAEYAARWPNGGSWTDGIDGHQCFVADSDEILIGSATKFSQLEVLLTTPSSKEIRPEFYFYNTGLAWVQFIPGDGSGGFTSDGIISWNSAALTNWKSDYDPGAADGSAGYYMKIKRTRAIIATPPTPTTIKLLEPTLYSWDEDGDLDVNDIEMNAGNIEGETKHLRFNIFDPNGVQTDDGEVCLWPVTDAAITITGITVTLDAITNEILGDLKYADTFIGLASAVVINDFDTTSGVRSDSSITVGAVPSGKTIYVSFDSAPHADITQACFDISYSYD